MVQTHLPKKNHWLFDCCLCNLLFMYVNRTSLELLRLKANRISITFGRLLPANQMASNSVFDIPSTRAESYSPFFSYNFLPLCALHFNIEVVGFCFLTENSFELLRHLDRNRLIVVCNWLANVTKAVSLPHYREQFCTKY